MAEQPPPRRARDRPPHRPAARMAAPRPHAPEGAAPVIADRLRAAIRAHVAAAVAAEAERVYQAVLAVQHPFPPPHLAHLLRDQEQRP